MNGSDYFSQQPNTRGGIAGAKAEASLFFPLGMGPVFQDSNGKWWQLRLAQNPDGTTYIQEDGKPTPELIEVEL